MHVLKAISVALFLSNVAPIAAFADDAEISKFQFWVEEEFKRPEAQVSEKVLSFRLPHYSIAKSIAWVGLQITGTLLKSDYVDQVVEVPAIAKVQAKLAKFKVVADKYGDFSQNTMDSARDVVAQFNKDQDLFHGLLNTIGSRVEGMKLLRVITELRSRLVTVSEQLDDGAEIID